MIELHKLSKDIKMLFKTGRADKGVFLKLHLEGGFFLSCTMGYENYFAEG